MGREATTGGTRGTIIWMLGNEPMLDACNVNTLPDVLLLQPLEQFRLNNYFILKLGKKGQEIEQEL